MNGALVIFSRIARMKLPVSDSRMTPRWIKPLVLAYLVICALAVLAYCAHRAAVYSFTHDEAITFLNYPHHSFSDLISHKYAYTNNHMLNSLAMKGSIALFGDSELACRLPNLLALVVYLVYAALLLRRCHPLIMVVAFPLLITHSFFIELFCLARGYGLSFGFLAMALYHGWRAAGTGHWKHMALFHAAGLLASVSNFALITAYIAVLLAFAILTAASWRSNPVARPIRIKVVALNSALTLLVLLALKDPVLRMLKQNNLDFGGKATFYADTVGTLIGSMMPGVNVLEHRLIIPATVLTVLVAVMLSLVGLRLRREGRAFVLDHGAGAMAVLTLVLIGMGAYAQHLLFGVDHLEGRFAIFLLPPLWFSLIGLTQLLARWHAPLPVALLFGLTAWSLPRHAKQLAAHYSWEWGYDAQTKAAMQALKQDHAETWNADGFVQVRNTWIFEPAMNYYRRTMGLEWMCELTRDSIRPDDDYRYVYADDTLARRGFTTVARFEYSGTVLLRSDAQLRALRGLEPVAVGDSIISHEHAEEAVPH